MTKQCTYSLEVIAPVFPVSDLRRSCAYYTECLLFETAFEWRDSEREPLNYAILQNGNVELHLSLAREPHKNVAYVFVNNVRDYFEAVKHLQAEISAPLSDQPWEMREFEVTDPDGNRIIFGEHLSRIEDA